MAEENNKLHFNADTGKWENLPEGYKIQNNKNYKIGDKTVAVLYTYQPYWSEYETVLLVADGKEAHYTVTTIPRNFDFSRVDSLDYDYKAAVANQQVRYELSWQFPGIVPRYEKNLFGFGLQPVFDDLEKAKEYAKRTRDVLVSCPTELLYKSFTKDHNPQYTYFRHDYIELNEYKVHNGIPVSDKNIYRVPVLLTQEADMFAVVDALKNKGYDIQGDGIKNVWYMDFDTEAGAKDFARALHAAMVENDKLSRPYADLMETLSNPSPDTDDIIYERIYTMEQYTKMMTRYGEGALDIDLEGKGVSTLDRITRNLPSTEIKTLRYDNGKMTFFGQDGNSYRIEHLSGDSIKSLMKVENEVLESEERSRSPKENPYYFCIANLTEDYLKEEFDKTLSFNTPRYLELAREEDWNYTLTTDLIYKSPLRQKGDEVIAQDSEYTVVFNRDNGESYHIYRNISEEDVRKLITLPSSGLNLGDNPTEDVKNIARRIESEQSAEFANTQANTESPKINIDMEENKEKTYYLSVAYLQESDAKEYLDKYRESDTKALLYEAANWDQGDDIVQSNVYSRQGVHPGDITLVQDENYALIYNPTVGGDYEVLRKITEQDIRDNINRYGLESDATEDVKKIAYAMVKEEFQSIKKEPAFEMESGDILHFQYNEQTNKVEVGTVTNAGLAPLHEFDYDHDYTLDENIGDIYSKLSDMEEYQPKETLQPERVSFDNKEDLQNYIKDYCEKHGWDSDLNHIDVSRITDMSDLFYATTFTGDISKWDVSNVTNMSAMFQESKYSGDISKWDISNVRDMSYMFCNSKIKNIPDLSLRADIKTKNMFKNTPFEGREKELKVSTPERVSFDNKEDLKAYITDYCEKNGWDSDLNHIDVSRITDMKDVFFNSQFTGDISQWDTSNVTTMEGMFADSRFNGDISGWDVSNVTSMRNMFIRSHFNQDISNWDTSNVINMSRMFEGSMFNQPIGEWNTKNVVRMDSMFASTPFNQPIGDWNTGNVKDMFAMFAHSDFNQPIGGWNTSNVKDMRQMFYDSKFNQPVGNWDTSKVDRMSGMFENNKNFNQPIGNWDTSKVKLMDYMFYESTFNKDISNWDVSSVENMEAMFTNSRFDGNITTWNVKEKSLMEKAIKNSRIEGIDGVLYNKPESVSFDNKEDLQAYIKDYCEKNGWDSDLNHIDVSRITDMNLLFAGTEFTGDISRWDTSNVKDMSDMFCGSAFNGDISGWNTGNVENMANMFLGSAFNQPIGGWNTSKVKDMSIMFAESDFDQPIDNWDMSNVKKAKDMFMDSKFSHFPSNWDLSNVESTKGMLTGTPIQSREGELKTLIGKTKPYTLPEQDVDMVHEVSPEQTKDAYAKIKQKNPEAIVICNGGDGKFRIFGKDAEFVSRELGIALDKRHSDGMAMITFTQREIDINLPKIIRSGRRAAIIEGTPDFIGENVKPEEEKPQKVNIVDKWKELKEQNPDKVILLHDDGRYMSYDSDARDICKALRIYTLKDVPAGLDLAYWEDKDEYKDRYDKVVDAIGNLSVWDIINPDTKEARQRAIVRKEEQPAEVKTWQELKEADPKNVVLTLKDGRYYAYQDDAKAVSKLLGLELIKREDYVMTTSFPVTALDVYGKRIKASGHKLVLTDTDYSAPVERGKADNTVKEDKPKVNPIDRWKELKAQNPDKITLMEHSTGYLVLGKDADAIPVNMGIIHEKFDTSLGTGLVVSSLYRDLDKLQKEVGPLAVWDDVDSKDIKVTLYPEEKMEQVQNEQQSLSPQAEKAPEPKEKQEETKSLVTMRQQWEDLKKENPDSVILLKSGGFYKTYEEDAKRASEILGITLTKNTKENCYMAGFPVTVLDEFLPKFNKANCPVELRDTVQHDVTSEQGADNKAAEKKEDQKNSEKTATAPQQTDEAARVAALKGEAYQAYLLDKALGNAAKNGGVFVNERKMAQASLFPHNDVFIPAFNNVIMTMHTERMGYATNTYTTYRGAQSMGLAVKRDEKCLGVNNFGISFFVNTFNSSDVIPKANYNQLPDDKKQQYRPANKMKGFREKLLLYNIDQTNTSARNKEVYKKMVADTHREKKAPSADPKENIRKYDDMVKKNPNSMPLFRTGHFYESYKEGALVLNHLFDSPIVEDQKKGCKVASFPASKINQYLPKIAKQYHVSLIESSDIINGKTTIDYRKEASDFIKKVAKEMGVKIDKTTYMLTSYDKKDDTISLHVNNLDPGKPNSTDIKDINAMYRAISNAAEIPDRLDRSGRIVLNYGDCEKYDALVTELAAASLMIRQGLPARISEENMELIPYWQRELRENPKMVNILELNTNATIKAIMRHYEGKEVDYSKLRGTSQRVFLPEKEYTVVRDLATYPNVENRSAVIIRDPESKEAAVILPAGASTEVNNEIPGMNKHRYELALKKEGYENVKFYNADGYLSLNQPNSYFKDKDVTVEQLHQYDLVEVMKLDLTKELERYEKPEIERIRGLKNDDGHYELYIKPVGKPEFTVKAQYADVTAFYKSFDNPNKREGEETRKAIGQKYFELVKSNPEFLTNLLNPNTEGINIDRIESVNVTKDPDTKKPLFSVKIDGQRYEKTVPNEIWQRFWTTSDPATYKRAYAAVLFEKELGRKETQDESIDRESPDTKEKKSVPVEIHDNAIDGQDNTTEPDIEQDDKKEIRRGGRGR